MPTIPALVRRASSRVTHLTARNRSLERLGRIRSDIASRLVPAEFWYGRYSHTFLERQPPAVTGLNEVPNVIWCFWLGENPLTQNRLSGLQRMREFNPKTPVRLVTAENLAELVVPEHPLHTAYEHLSVVHRSDYLRAYILHHHGGGYSDIKPPLCSWGPALERLRDSNNPVLGVDIGSPKYASHLPDRLGSHLRRYYRRVLSGSTIAAKSHTDFTGEWLREVERRLDYYAPALQESPGGVWGRDPSYPIPWTGIMGDVLQPLSLKYQDVIIYDSSVRFDDTVPYR